MDPSIKGVVVVSGVPHIHLRQQNLYTASNRLMLPSLLLFYAASMLPLIINERKYDCATSEHLKGGAVTWALRYTVLRA